MIRKTITTVMSATLLLLASCSQTDSLTFPTPKKQAYSKTKYTFLRNEETSVEVLDAKELNELFSLFTHVLSGYYIKEQSEMQKEFARRGFLYKTSLKDITIASNDLFALNPELKKQVSEDLKQNLAEIMQLSHLSLKYESAAPGKPGRVGYGSDAVSNFTQVNGRGLSLHLYIRNSLIGTALLDQILNEHLGDGIIKSPDLRRRNNSQVLVSGSNYTELEHHWDVAYELSRGKHIRSILETDFIDFPFLSGANKRVNSAFIAGRQALTEYDYTKVEYQVGIIRRELSQAIATQAIYLLKTAKPDVEERVSNAFPRLSEAYGFIYALIASRRFDGSRYADRSEVLGLLHDLSGGKNGFWDTKRLSGDDDHKGSIENISRRITNLFKLWEPPLEEEV